ncbi:hypothetical protein [Brevibacillus parabrevis]|uniref:hypothetical protein n=1 Tax=Brevibacillus parabrevis TaxID=54914 RepID=UPI002E2190B6|nr:hypothetical protein [Brevibacillus parabrevis]
MGTLSGHYMKTYFPQLQRDDKQYDTEKKRLNNLKNKLLTKEVYSRGLPFQALPLVEGAKLANFLLNVANEREFISNMAKNEIRKDYSFLAMPSERYLWISAAEADSFEWDMKMFQAKSFYRCYLGWDSKGLLELLEHHAAEILHSLNEHPTLASLTHYLEYLSTIWLQWVNQRIIKRRPLEETKEELGQILQTLQSWSEQADADLDTWRKKQTEAGTLTAEEVSGVFAAYRKKMSEWWEYLEVLSTLKDEIKEDLYKPEGPELFGLVPEKWKTGKILVDETIIKDLQPLITEGKRVDDFHNKLEETQKMIEEFRLKGGRDCYPNCPQDIKVYFREIFMSKSTYKGQKALRIARDYLIQVDLNPTKPFKDKAHYLFFREKISRGYFREQGKLDLYMHRIEFQEKLFEWAIKAYLFYDYKEMQCFLGRIYQYFIETVKMYPENQRRIF